LTLTISGVGIVNISGITQNVRIARASFHNTGTLAFSNSAMAGNNVSISNDESGTINFFDHSNAGSAFILNGYFGSTNFFNRSSAGNADMKLSATGTALSFSMTIPPLATRSSGSPITPF
jgi:hypothetical protein